MPPPSRKEQLIELSVFLFLVVPTMAFSLVADANAVGSFLFMALATILRDLALVALVLYFLWKNDEPRRRIGWNGRPVRREILLGAALFLPFSFSAQVVENLLRAAGLPAPENRAPGFLAVESPLEIAVALALVAVVAVAEETIFRGYLILRIRAVTESSALAVVLSAAIFSVGHGYAGPTGVLTTGALGLLLGVLYLWRGSLIAPIVLHFLQNFAGIILAPIATR